jgi:peptidoglycan/LPS O-acetylase OafA/YrhL
MHTLGEKMSPEEKKFAAPHEGHIAVLDGLRAMAICLVLVHHAMQKWWSPFVQVISVGPVDLTAFLRNGWSGVDLFFVLSGFLITGQLLDSRLEMKETRSKNIAYYFRRRFCRITPAYYVVLTFVTAAFVGMGDPQHPEHAAWIQSYLCHLLFLQDFVYPDYWPIFWSLAVEAQFYLLAPFLIIGLLRLREPNSRYVSIFLSILLLAALRAIAAVAWHFPPGEAWFYKLRVFFPFSLDSILAGMLCGFLWRDEKVRALLHQKKTANLIFWIGLILFFLSTGVRPPRRRALICMTRPLRPCVWRSHSH